MLNSVEIGLLAEARNGGKEQFSQLIEPYRAELQVHCYRMLGSLEDAEDLVQETYLRAWRSLDKFIKNVSFRAWLYKIATNACLDALDKPARRVLPMTTHSPADPHLPHTVDANEILWLEPYPDSTLSGIGMSPEARYSLLESVRLAFMVALQSLPPRQRAALLLSDVLGWRAKEVADYLEMTVSAVNSQLFRARATLRENRHQTGETAVMDQRLDSSMQLALDQYVRAWETADIQTFVSLLKEDATFAMPPSPSWYQGREAIQTFLLATLFRPQSKERWKLRPTRSNGESAFGLYEYDAESGLFRGSAVQVLTLQNNHIAEVITFVNSALFPYFNLPPELPAKSSTK